MESTQHNQITDALFRLHICIDELDSLRIELNGYDVQSYTTHEQHISTARIEQI